MDKFENQGIGSVPRNSSRKNIGTFEERRLQAIENGHVSKKITTNGEDTATLVERFEKNGSLVRNDISRPAIFVD